MNHFDQTKTMSAIWVLLILGLLNPTIASKPKLIELKKDFDLMEKMNSFTLHCYIQSGSTPLFFDWHKNGHRLFNSSKVNIVNFDSLSTLSLTELHRSDSGAYICSVKNAFGNDSTSTIINIKGFVFLYF